MTSGFLSLPSLGKLLVDRDGAPTSEATGLVKSYPLDVTCREV